MAAEFDRPGITLTDATTLLTSRVMALTKDGIADYDQSITELLAKAEAVKAAGVPGETAQKVDEICATAKRWDAVAAAVPQIVERLVALKALHERGADFGRTLTQLETAQAEVKGSLASEKAMLEKMEASFKANTATMETNFKSMEARIEALNASIAKLG